MIRSVVLNNLMRRNWSDLSLNTLLFEAATALPYRVALVDPPDRPHWSDGRVSALNYCQLAALVRVLASYLREKGLEPGDTVAVQMPNTIESIVITLALHYAGIVPAPLPIHWRGEQLLQAAKLPRLAGIVAPTRFGNASIAEWMMLMANWMDLDCPVYCFGDDAPEGTRRIDLAKIIDQISSHELGIIQDSRLTQPQTQAMKQRTWLSLRAGPNAQATGQELEESPMIGYNLSRQNIIAGALQPLALRPLKEGAQLISTYPISSIAAVCGVLVPWLAAKGTLFLHQLHSPDLLAKQLIVIQPDLAVLPELMAADVLSRVPERTRKQMRYAVVTQGGQAPKQALPSTGNPVRLIVLNGAAVWAQYQAEGPPTLPADADFGPFREQIAPLLQCSLMASTKASEIKQPAAGNGSANSAPARALEEEPTHHRDPAGDASHALDGIDDDHVGGHEPEHEPEHEREALEHEAQGQEEHEICIRGLLAPKPVFLEPHAGQVPSPKRGAVRTGIMGRQKGANIYPTPNAREIQVLQGHTKTQEVEPLANNTSSAVA